MKPLDLSVAMCEVSAFSQTVVNDPRLVPPGESLKPLHLCFLRPPRGAEFRLWKQQRQGAKRFVYETRRKEILSKRG